MSKYKIIIISRQFGSGGHEIVEKLAERLGIPLYDNQLVTIAAEKPGYTGLEWGSIYYHQALLNAVLLGIAKIVDLLELAYRA